MFRLRTNARAEARVSVAIYYANAQPLPAYSWVSYYSMATLRKRQASYLFIVPTSITFFWQNMAYGAEGPKSWFLAANQARRLPVLFTGTTIRATAAVPRLSCVRL